MKLMVKLTAFLAASLISVSAFAFPIASAGTEGLPVIASGGEVVATYEGNSAGYSNDLLLNLVFIFNNHATPIGSMMSLGSFAAGTELVFNLFVHNTGDNWYTGAASRNADNLFHARVQQNWKPGTTLVSFEDLRGTPEGANGYNDLSFSFTNTQSEVPEVPEPASISLLLAGLALLGLATRRQHHGK
ncbi:PEP-CTERM sorting domain-containing protein [Undibacterium sp.]|uniref:PEP-CTERM sorting domain-containing protein n=1 Tax=Undibacterium sp. TaxID=1914977 RepID=UPI0025F82F33|nr:PEP-CTERM sorting domain-containing protein [Undibacterium sp.]